MPIALLVLSAFAIGTTEFVIMELLLEVAGNFTVSLPDAGWLVGGYALDGLLICLVTFSYLPLPPLTA